jgi:hypothetical protein
MLNLFDVEIPDHLEYSVTKNKRGELPRTYLLRLSDWQHDNHATQRIPFELLEHAVAPQCALQGVIDHMLTALESHRRQEQL